MTWSRPADLPTNRTNATPQQDTHPNDHNAIGATVNQVIAQVDTLDKSTTELAKIIVGATPGGNINPGGSLITASLTLGPAGVYLVTYGVAFVSTTAIIANVSILLGGVTQFVQLVRTGVTEHSVYFGAPVQSLVNSAAITCKVDNLGGAIISCYADPSNHRLASIAGH